MEIFENITKIVIFHVSSVGKIHQIALQLYFQL